MEPHIVTTIRAIHSNLNLGAMDSNPFYLLDNDQSDLLDPVRAALRAATALRRSEADESVAEEPLAPFIPDDEDNGLFIPQPDADSDLESDPDPDPNAFNPFDIPLEFQFEQRFKVPSNMESPNMQSLSNAELVKAALASSTSAANGKTEATSSSKKRSRRGDATKAYSSALTATGSGDLARDNDEDRRKVKLMNAEFDRRLSELSSERPNLRRGSLPNVDAPLVISSDDDVILTRSTTVQNQNVQPARKRQRLVQKKIYGTPVPKTLDDANPADRMVWEWKNMGKPWADIRNEYHRITGTMPGESTLSVRYSKINEKFARHGGAGNKELIRFKKEAEAELSNELWERVAEKMAAYSEMSEYHPGELKKRYEFLLRQATPRQPALTSSEPSTGAVVKQENEGESDGDDDQASLSGMVANALRGGHLRSVAANATSGLPVNGGRRDSESTSIQVLSPSSSATQQIFQAPFSYNLRSGRIGNRRGSMITADNEQGAAEAGGALIVRRGQTFAVAENDPPTPTPLPAHAEATANSPAQLMSSSPFMKLSEAYNSDSDMNEE